MKKDIHIVISSLSIRRGAEHSVLPPIKIFLRQLEQLSPKETQKYLHKVAGMAPSSLLGFQFMDENPDHINEYNKVNL